MKDWTVRMASYNRWCGCLELGELSTYLHLSRLFGNGRIGMNPYGPATHKERSKSASCEPCRSNWSLQAGVAVRFEQDVADVLTISVEVKQPLSA
jgi:hypothetical protein